MDFPEQLFHLIFIQFIFICNFSYTENVERTTAEKKGKN